MTTKTAIGILAMMWSLSFILTTLITITVPVNVMWPLALIRFDGIIAQFFALPRLTAATLIAAANVFLQYKVISQIEKLKRIRDWEMKEKDNFRS